MPELNISNEISIKSLFTNFFSVPEFQRDYVWDEDDVEGLLSDIYSSFQHDISSEYFIGAIVLSKEPSGTLEIIDGQQRITTLFLTFVALSHFNKIQSTIAIGQNSIDSVKPLILENQFTPSGPVPQYKLRLPDPAAEKILKRIVENGVSGESKDSISASTIMASYKSAADFLTSTLKDELEFNRF